MVLKMYKNNYEWKFGFWNWNFAELNTQKSTGHEFRAIEFNLIIGITWNSLSFCSEPFNAEQRPEILGRTKKNKQQQRHH